MLPFHLKGLLAAIIAGTLAGVASAAASGSVRAWWVVGAVLVVFIVVLSRGLLQRRRLTYTITSRRLTIEAGLVAREVHETRLEQIQNVNLSQSLLERILGVGTIAFDTAGGAAFEFSFAGVSDPGQIVHTVDQVLHERALGRD
jgi:uncharacterized membrane protein YdbT with pleckstrin-like domain